MDALIKKFKAIVLSLQKKIKAKKTAETPAMQIQLQKNY